MRREPEFCFAADLGGTKLAAAIADARGRILAERTEATDRRGASFVAEQIAACAGTLAQDAGIELARARHVMVGIPGAIDPRTHRVSLVPNITGLENFEILAFLRERFGADVAIENDVNLALLGEHALGCARQCRNAAFLSLGTGAGLGLLIDGRLYRGTSGCAGEIADLPLGRDPAAPMPLPGGSFELAVGSSAILERYRRAGGAEAATVREIFTLLEQGDTVAESVIDTTARWVAFAVVTLQSVLDLELIVFGGSIGVRPELHARVKQAVGTLLSRPINTAISELGDRAGLMGAAWAAGQALRRRLEPA